MPSDMPWLAGDQWTTTQRASVPANRVFAAARMEPDLGREDDIGWGCGVVSCHGSGLPWLMLVADAAPTHVGRRLRRVTHLSGVGLGVWVAKLTKYSLHSQGLMSVHGML